MRAGTQADAARRAADSLSLPIPAPRGSLPFHQAHENRLEEEKAKCNLENFLSSLSSWVNFRYCDISGPIRAADRDESGSTII